MSKGRKATAPHLKAIQGTNRPSRENKEAPEPPREVPEMPQGLTTRAKKYWGDLVGLLDEMGVITLADQSVLELLCETYSEWKHLNSTIKTTYKGKTSYLTVSKDGAEMYRAYPEVAQRSDAARRFQSLLSEFGLTPAARGKVKAIGKEKQSDPWADI